MTEAFLAFVGGLFGFLIPTAIHTYLTIRKINKRPQQLFLVRKEPEA